MTYSSFFQVLHDERSPVGELGHGTHYSVVRTVLPVTEKADPKSVEEQIFDGVRRRKLQMLNLAIIWDEDHDERIWGVIERLHAAGLLAPIHFIGERKGGVSIICDPETDYSNGGFDNYCQLIECAVQADEGDEWSVEVMQGIEDKTGQIINAPRARVEAYLRGIQASWTLGPIDWQYLRNMAPSAY